VATKFKPRKSFNSFDFDETCSEKVNIRQTHMFKTIHLSSKTSDKLHKVLIKKLTPEARLPERSTPNSIGYDVYPIRHQIIQPNEVAQVPLGIAVQLPLETYLRVASRSSMA